MSTRSKSSTDDLQEELRRVRGQLAQAQQRAEDAERTARTAVDIKLPHPEPFNGDPNLLRPFCNAISVRFRAQPARFASDEAKVAYVAGLLVDTALAWYGPYEEENHPILKNHDAFMTALKAEFQGADSAATAATKIRQLVQTGSIASYCAEFRRLATELKWGDAALISQFQLGLEEELANILLGFPEPDTLSATIALSIRCGNRLEQHRLQRQLRGRPAPPKAAAASVMQLDAVAPTSTPAFSSSIPPARRGPLTARERQRRFENRLCMYCASPDHFRQNCPERAGKPSNGQVRPQ